MAKEPVTSLTRRIREGAQLGVDEARACAELLLDGAASDADAAALLVELAERGETPEEILGVARAILARAAEPPPEVCGTGVDLAGTGGSGLARFNVSTTAALVVAAQQVPVAKHGNRGSRQPNGSFDFLEQLDMPFELAGEAMARGYARAHLVLLFARLWHPAMGKVAGARKLAGRRTVFNLAAPLCNPTAPPFQVVGASDPDAAEKLIEVLRALGRQRAIVMCGHPGIEDFSTSGETVVHELAGATVRSYRVGPEEFGLPTAAFETLPAGDAVHNAAAFERLAAGEPFDGPTAALRDLVALNAGAALYCAGSAESIAEATTRSIEVIGTGGLGEQRRRFQAAVGSVGSIGSVQ